ncbi:MAG: cohesin domain-containing protein [Clostridia bacterium]|nr:cohesin domain-containing protein [Clostridia bacterium]
MRLSWRTWLAATFTALAMVFLSLSCSHCAAASEAPAAPIAVQNQFIKIIVNSGPNEAGRFGVETTGGDPRNSGDDGLPLIYGRPTPWTSYTTVKIDDTDWVFGGKTTRRAGRAGRYGEAVEAPKASGDKIVCSYRLGDILVTQELSFVKSPTTRYADTARVHYTVENVGNMTRSVGLRVLLDTMLGANDGAPLRAGESAIITDTILSGSEIPDYWQAFDSIVDPSITSQATMIGGELTPPSRVSFSNWGNYADRLWDAQMEAGKPFKRELEADLDSAAAMYWDPAFLAPGEVRHYVTYYGLGAITLAPGRLALGLTSPAEVGLAPSGVGSFLAVAYIHNTGEGPAHDVETSIVLPLGFTLAEGQKQSRTIGDMEPGQVSQAAWQVVADWGGVGRSSLVVQVSASNADSNRASREIEVVGPPSLLAYMIPQDPLRVQGERRFPWPVRARLHVENTGGSTAYWVRVIMDSIGGFSLGNGDSRELLIGHIEARESEEVTWTLSGEPAPGTHTISATAKAPGLKDSTGSIRLQVPELLPKIWLAPTPSQAAAGSVVTVEVMVTNLPDLQSISFDLRYDPKLLDIAMVSAGSLFVDGNEVRGFSEGEPWSTPGLVSDVGGTLSAPMNAWGSAARVYFIAKGFGNAVLVVENVVVSSSSGAQMKLVPDPCVVQVSR